MGEYCSYEPRLSDVVPLARERSLKPRNRLLLDLLSDREAVRIVCAPSLHGKTVLAGQYAETAFSFSKVMWVQATDPRFLLDLDNESLEESMRRKPACNLVVFNGVSKLKGQRRIKFVSLVGRLFAKRCEVLITTEDSTLNADVMLPTVLLDARQLSLVDDEVPRFEQASKVLSKLERESYEQALLSSSPKRLLPAVMLDLIHGRDRFISVMLKAKVTTNEEMLAVLALSLGQGEVKQFAPFFNESIAHLVSSMERMFPFAGIRRMSGEFESFALSPSERFELFCTHLPAMVPLSAFQNEREFVEAFADLCLEGKNEALLSKIMQECMEERDRQRFAEEHRLRLLPEGWRACVDESEEVEAPACLDANVEINLFGRFEMTQDGEPLPEKGEVRRKAKVLLALLICNHGKELPRYWVERAMWPDRDPSKTRSSFYNLWSYLRRMLEAPDARTLASRQCRDCVSLNWLTFTCDVVTVDELCDTLHGNTDSRYCAKALGKIEQLYQGPLLPGVKNEQLDVYRSMYQNKVIDTVVDGVRLLMRDGQRSLALHFASFAFHVEPTREDVCYHYMLAQKMLGQRAGAISTYISCRRALVERMGMDGSRRLDELYSQILNEVSAQDDDLD